VIWGGHDATLLRLEFDISRRVYQWDVGAELFLKEVWHDAFIDAMWELNALEGGVATL
jgi:hypothetical protein